MSYKVKILNGVLKLKTFSDVVLNILGIKDLGTQTGNVTNGYVDWSIQHLTQTTAQWNADTTTILLKGQLGIEDTGGTAFKLKIGNGTDLWSALSYISGGGGGGGTQDLQSVTDYGATTTDEINTGGVISDYYELDTTATPTNAVAKMIWNSQSGTAELGLLGGSINAKLAQDLYARVVNKTGSNLLKSGYKAVKISSAQGQRLAINLAQANNDNNSADTIGIVAENIDNNQEGFVITVGQLTGINTTGSLQSETWNDGNVLYLSPTTAGSITNVKPDGSTGHIVVLGYVEYAHQNNGKIYVKIMNGWELDELHNVYISSLSNNQVLTYESATQLWKNKSVNTALGYTAENTANKGVANGYVALASDSKVDAAYLPSYVSDVLEYANLSAFPVTGASNKIYVALDTNKVYRWSGSIYIEVAANSGVWGAITGTITNQTDLVNYVKGYSLNMDCYGTFNPSDNGVLYIGGFQTAPSFTDFNGRLICPKSGTIKSVVFASRQTFGSGESSTIALGINGSYSNISTTIVFSSTVNNQLITGLSRSVNAGDYITIRWTCPTWVTNPLNVLVNCIIYIE